MSLAASAGRGPGTVWSPTHVQVTVLQARGLRAKGPGGTSDAYAVIQVGKEKYATSVSERSLGAPVWREEATFELPPLLSSGAAPAASATLQLTVLHRALLGLDKFLGRAEVDLRELHRDQGRRKTQWYTLKSKPGKKDKERGEIEVDIQFMRNNMTASMFDLSVKDKSRNPFGKLKDKMKGKNKDSASDTASAIVPSTPPTVDSDDESPSKDKKKKSKFKTLFSKTNLQKTPLSQSMSVLPTSKSDKVLLRPGDFQSRWEDDDEEESSSASDIMSHKKTASAEPKQLNQINFNLPKKEGLSFLGGLRSKNDSLSRSNVCINGNHVYVEQPEGKNETKDSTSSSSPSPQGLRKKHLFSSTENLAPRSWKEPGEGGAVSSDKRLSESSTKNSPKSMTLPSSWLPVSGDIRENPAPAKLEAVKESKESKKPESRKSSLLSLVTGKKDVAKGGEGGSPATSPGRDKDSTLWEDGPGPVEGLVKRPEDMMAIVSGQGKSLNPFEDVQITEPEADPGPKSEPTPPVTSAWAPQTKAVKPRLEVSPEVQPTARLPSSPDSSPFFSALPSSSGQTPVPPQRGHESETQPSESPSVFSAFSPPLAAPISTSTPIKSWPSTDQGQAGSEEPSLLFKAELQKENLTQVPNTVSRALGSLSKQPPIPGCEETEESSVGKVGETDTGKNTSGHGLGKSFLTQPEMGQQEELLKFLPLKQDSIPSPDRDQKIAVALSVRSGRKESPAGKPPMGLNTDLGSRSGSFEENKVRDGGMTLAIKPAIRPLHMGDSDSPLDSESRRHEEVGLGGGEAPKKVKKHVSFSEQLLMEEEVTSPGLVEEGSSSPQELRCEGAAAGTVSDGEPAGPPHAEDSKGEAVTEPRPLNSRVPAAVADHFSLSSREDSVSEGPVPDPSPGKDIPLFRAEEDDTLMAENQSKASDHEGLLSDPLSDLQSALDVKSPVTADLDLTLPSIPEVASDDERVEEVEDGRETAKVATMEVGASPLSTLPASPERALSGGTAGGAVPEGGLRDLRPKAAEASVRAPSEQSTVLGTRKPDLGRSSPSDTRVPGPGDGGEETLMGNGRLSQPPALALGFQTSSPSFSEPSPAIHSSPGYPHSDTQHTSTAESQIKATAEGLPGQAENSGKRKPLLQAWVSPSETHPVSVGTGSAKHRLHPVKPMNTKTINSSFGTATIISENLINEAIMKKYTPSDPAFAYAQLTHDELIQLVLKQKETISKKEFQVRELEDYIDNLLVRVMEETPNILRIPAQGGKKAGKM